MCQGQTHKTENKCFKVIIFYIHIEEILYTVEVSKYSAVRRILTPKYNSCMQQIGKLSHFHNIKTRTC